MIVPTVVSLSVIILGFNLLSYERMVFLSSMFEFFVVIFFESLLLIIYHNAEFDVFLEVRREVVSLYEILFDCFAEFVEKVLYFDVIDSVELIAEFRELDVVREDVVDFLFELLKLFVDDALRVLFFERRCNLCDKVEVLCES